MNEINVTAALEAILFAAGDSVPIPRLSLVLGLAEAEISAALDKLAELYSREERGIRILRYEDRVQMVSAGEYSSYIVKTMETRRAPMLSQSALETLAVVAYFQPVTRAYVDSIRGVDSTYTVTSLAERGLIEACGKLEAPGRPTLYRTTDAFLRVLDISNLSELPQLPDLTTNEGIEKLKQSIRELESENVAEGQLPISEL